MGERKISFGLGGWWRLELGNTEGPSLRQETINIQPMYRLYSERKLLIIFGDTLLVKNSLFLHSSACLPFLDEKLHEICCKIPNVPFWGNNSKSVFINSHFAKKVGEKKNRSRRSWVIYNPCSVLSLPSHQDAAALGFGSCTEPALCLQSFISAVQATLGFSKLKNNLENT